MSPRKVAATKDSRCSGEPCARIVGSAHSPTIVDGWLSPARANSWAITTWAAGVAPMP